MRHKSCDHVMYAALWVGRLAACCTQDMLAISFNLEWEEGVYSEVHCTTAYSQASV